MLNYIKLILEIILKFFQIKDYIKRQPRHKRGRRYK
jgi:hypothetical protein